MPLLSSVSPIPILLFLLLLLLVFPELIPARPLPRLTLSSTLIIESGEQVVPQPVINAVDEINAHFAKMDEASIVRLEEKLARAKEFVHRMEYGGRAFNDEFPEEICTQSRADRAKSVSISSAQPNISADMAPILFEGDILLNERQISAILKSLERKQQHSHIHRNDHTKRSISTDPESRWRRMPIKFRLHDSLELSAIQQILEAITYWENNTCVTFEPMDDQKEDEDFLEFFKGEGCYSMIGRYGGRQGVSIGAGCERAVGIVEHEIGHVLGLWHEQSRPDAWEYVQVEKEFVLPSYMADFQLRGPDEVLTLGLPYDYGSVMHYGPTAFSSDGIHQTLVTKNVLFQSTIGQRDRLAFYDIMTINKAYCADKCGGIAQLQSSVAGGSKKKMATNNCENGGYLNPKRCGECLCPSGYGGSRCDQAENAKNAQCGGELSVGLNEWTWLESPGYDGDGYKSGQQCNWLIRSPSGTRVLAEFVDDFSLFCATICVDYVELKMSRDQRLTGARFCCDQRFPGQLISEHNQMAILFRVKLSQDVGFRLRLRATELNTTNHQGTRRNEGNDRSDRPAAEGRQSVPVISKKSFLPGRDVWGEWGPWGTCSRPCGGCGIRNRVRSCLSEECADGLAQQFGACNLRACPLRPNCAKVLALSRLCHPSGLPSGASAPPPLSPPTALLCAQVGRQLAECNQPSCCPPFYAAPNGQCVEGGGGAGGELE